MLRMKTLSANLAALGYRPGEEFSALNAETKRPEYQLGALSPKGVNHVLSIRPIRVRWKGHQIEIPTEVLFYLVFRVLNHWHF